MLSHPVRGRSCLLPRGCWLEVRVGSVFVDDVGPAPRLVTDQLPLVARAAVVLREQDIARTDGERRTGLHLELQRAGQGDDETRDRVLVPRPRSARPRFPEGQLGDGYGTADGVAARPLGEIDRAFLEQRVTIVAGPHAHTADHRLPASLESRPVFRRGL